MTARRSHLSIATFALVLLAALIAVGLIADKADARKVANPGTVTAEVTGGVVRIKDNAFDLAELSPHVTLTGTVANNGDLNFPTSGINVPPISADGNTIRLQPTHAWTGNVNPLSGSMNLRLRFRLKVEASGAGDSCFVGSTDNPIDINTLNTGTTSPPGPNAPISGTPYNPADGTVSIVNNSFAVTQTASGCGPFGAGNGTVNDTVGLPSASGNNEARLTMDFNPNVQKGVNASFTVNPASGTSPLNASFSAAGSTISAGIKTCAVQSPSSPACGYRWDFDGNGTTDAVTNAPTTTNVYSTPGTYQARLTIFDNDGDSDTTTRTVTVLSKPDLSITKTHTGNFKAGTQGTYSIAVANAGPGPTNGTTTVTDTLPAGLTYVSGSGSGWSCSASGQNVTCDRTASIAAGGSAPAITLTVAVGNAARPSVTNTATVTTPAETATSNNSSSDPTTVDAIDLSIVKSHAGSFRVGRNESYSLDVTNVGTLSTTGTTTVADTLPQGMTYVSSSAPAGWTCGATGQNFTCTHPGAIAPEEAATIGLTVAVDDSALPSRTNTATVTTPGDSDPTDDSSSDLTVVVASPDLSIDKRHLGSFRVGGQGTYTLSVKNEGALPSTGTTTVTDTVPASLPVVSATGAGWDCTVTGQDVSCTSDEVLTPDEVASPITVTVGVSQSALPSVTNSATVASSGTGQGADPNPANDSDSDPTTVTAIDLTIDKSHAGSGFPIGGNGTYSLAVRNAGSAATIGSTTVTDTLPADLTYVSASGSGWTCGASGQTVTCTRTGSIAAGASAPAITLDVVVANTTAESVTNSASVQTSEDVDSANDADTDVTTLTAADLEITKTHGGDFKAGTTRAYELKVRNVGPLPTTGTSTVTDTLPAGLSYVSASGPNWTCGAVGQVVTCNRTTSIGAGAPASTITLQVAVGAAATPAVTNTATVSNANDRNPANDSDSDPTVVDAADLAIEKRHLDDLRAGAPATYEIDVDNVGSAATASTATVTDTLPSGLTYTGFSGSEWSCSAAGQVVTCEHADAIAAAGSAGSLELRTQVAPGAGNELTNTASVSVANDSTSTNNSSSDTAAVGRVDVSIDKSHAGDLPRGGRTVYQLAVKNDGSSSTVGPVRVTDQLPAGLRYASAGGSGWSCSAAGSTVECAHADPVNASASADPINLEVEVDRNADGAITNTATVATRDDVNPANNSDSDPGAVTARSPDMAVSLRPRGGTAFRAGGSGTYNMAVRNVGTVATTGATTTTLDLPGGVSYDGVSGDGWTCSASGSTVTCTHADTFAPESRSDVGIAVSVADNATLGIAGGAVSAQGDKVVDNNTDSDIMFFTKIDVAIGLSHQGDFPVGSGGAFAVSVRNDGSAATVSSTVVKDSLPKGLTFDGASGAGWNCSAGGQDVTCEHPSAIAAGGSADLTLKVKADADAPSQVTNQVTASTTDDVQPGNNSASDTVGVGNGGGALKIAGGKVKVSRSGKATIAVSCADGATETCKGKLELTAAKGSASLGSASFKVDPGKSAKVKVKLAKSARKQLAKDGKLEALASAGGKPVEIELISPAPKRG